SGDLLCHEMAHARGNPAIGETLAMAGPLALGEQTGLAIPGQAAAETIHARRAGRPPGRRNYRTEQTVAFLATKGKLPAEHLPDAISRGWRWLAAELKITPKEAFELRLRMIESLLPYTAPKLASLEIDAKGGAAGAVGAGALHLLAAQTVAGMLQTGARN